MVIRIMLTRTYYEPKLYEKLSNFGMSLDIPSIHLPTGNLSTTDVSYDFLLNMILLLSPLKKFQAQNHKI